jgi:hypothetical protein
MLTPGTLRRLLLVAALATPAWACNQSDPAAAANACTAVCEKIKSCGGNAPPRCSPCPYGGHLSPGLAPSPVCADLAAHERCVQAAVRLSCDATGPALAACPRCGVLDGGPCASDADCEKYDPDWRCDLGRPGGYCTRRCEQADSDCSAIGPEVCTGGPAPSFDPQPPAGQRWCFLGCKTDSDCRAAEGYRCVRGREPSDPTLGICDRP